MNVLFLTANDFISFRSRSIYADLMQEFMRNGHVVYVVSPNERHNKKKTYCINEGQGKILRVSTGNIKRTNIFEKGLSTVFIGTQFKRAIRRYLDDVKFDLILYSTPPITLVNVIAYIKNRDNAKTYLLLKDIFPQGAVDLDVMRKIGITSILYKYFRSKEKKLYAQSDYVGCMSQANVDYVLKNNPEISSDIVEICPNSIEPITIEKDQNKIKEVRGKYNIPLNKTVFIYGGNLGKPQGIDFLIECLKANKANEQIYFVIAGSGTEFNKLKAFIGTGKPTNVQLLTQLPKNDYKMLANSCDVGLVFLDRRFTVPNFPSRLLSYMQASMPVLAATDVNTDVGRVIENGKFGFWSESSDVGEFNRKLQQLCDVELRKQMGTNARKYLEDNYTAKHSYNIIMKHFGERD